MIWYFQYFKSIRIWTKLSQCHSIFCCTYFYGLRNSSEILLLWLTSIVRFMHIFRSYSFFLHIRIIGRRNYYAIRRCPFSLSIWFEWKQDLHKQTQSLQVHQKVDKNCGRQKFVHQRFLSFDAKPDKRTHDRTNTQYEDPDPNWSLSSPQLRYSFRVYSSPRTPILSFTTRNKR